MAAPDFERAAGLLERHALTRFFRGEVMQVQAWLAGLPDSVLRSRPLLCVLYANTLAYTGSFQPPALDVAEDWLLAAQRALVEALSEPDSADLPEYDLTRSFLALSRAYLSQWRDEPPDKVIALTRRALDGLPPEDAQLGHLNFQRLRSGLNFNLGISLLRSGDEAAAVRALAEARRAAQACGDPVNVPAAVRGILRNHAHLPEVIALCRDLPGDQAGSVAGTRGPGLAG
jgi:LuxR family maltose regulon positive regulatory protein